MREQLETRTWHQPVEFRTVGDGPGRIGGYAAAFSKYSRDLGGYVERVAPTAFTKALADNAPVLARYNHQMLLASTEAGTLRMAVDDTGLSYEIDLPDTSTGRDVRVLAERGDLRYSSFAFQTITDSWGVTGRGFPLRTLEAVQLLDVAPVDSPAYWDSSVGVRSLAERIGRDPTGMDPASVCALIAPAGDEIEELELRRGQVDNHPLRDRLAVKYAVRSAD